MVTSTTVTIAAVFVHVATAYNNLLTHFQTVCIIDSHSIESNI
jgi:hypothetical protein